MPELVSCERCGRAVSSDAVRRVAGLHVCPAGADKPPIVLAFLLPHQRSAHGDKADFLVSVNVIEAMTGLDFFRELPDTTALEDGDTWEVWKKHFAN